MQGWRGTARLLVSIIATAFVLGAATEHSLPTAEAGQHSLSPPSDQPAIVAEAGSVLSSLYPLPAAAGWAIPGAPVPLAGLCAELGPACFLPVSQGEAGVYRVYFDSPDRLAKLAVDHDIWEVNRDAGYAVLALTAQDTVDLRSLGYRLEPEVEQEAYSDLGPLGFSCYRNVDVLYARLQALVAAYPGLAELIDYGDSWLKAQGLAGYDLLVLKITNAWIEQPKARFLLMANIHGREITTPETALFFAEHLLSNYGVEPDVSWIVDYHEVYVIVTANPDARRLVEDGCYQRKNLNNTLGECRVCDLWGSNHYGVDLNRNNPYHWGGASMEPCRETYQGSGPASEPETYYLNDFVRSLFDDRRPDDDESLSPVDTSGLLISLHSYGNLVLWPWGWTTDPAPNSDRLQTLGRKLAYFNAYDPMQSCQLYPTTGDTGDWAYGELGIAAYIFELGEAFFQPCADLQRIMEENLGALLYAAKASRLPYRNSGGPDALALSALPAAGAAGASVRLSATIDDTRYQHSQGIEPVQSTAEAVYYIDVPPWIAASSPITQPMVPVDGAFDEAIEEVKASIDTANLSAGRHTIYVRGRDSAGNWGVLSAAFLDLGKVHAFLPVVSQDR